MRHVNNLNTCRELFVYDCLWWGPAVISEGLTSRVFHHQYIYQGECGRLLMQMHSEGLDIVGGVQLRYKNRCVCSSELAFLITVAAQSCTVHRQCAFVYKWFACKWFLCLNECPHMQWLINHLLHASLIVRVHFWFYSMGDVVASQVTMFVLDPMILLHRKHED